jgi:hypothetical protein
MIIDEFLLELSIDSVIENSLRSSVSEVTNFLYFWGFHPVASIITIYLGAPTIATVFFRMFFITITYPLHVLAPMGHLQLKKKYIYIYTG